MYVYDLLHKQKRCLAVEIDDATHISVTVQNRCTHLLAATPSSDTVISLNRAIVRKQEICETRTSSLFTQEATVQVWISPNT